MAPLKVLVLLSIVVNLLLVFPEKAESFESGLKLLRGSIARETAGRKVFPETPATKEREGQLTRPKGVCHSAYSTPPAKGVPSMPSTWWSNDLEDGAQVQIRTKWLTWLGPRGGNWSNALTADQTEAPPVTQFFKVRKTGNGQIALQAPNGKIVSVESSGTLAPRANKVADESTFYVLKGGSNKIQIQGPTGAWLSANSEGMLSWVQTPREEETFDVREVKEVPAIRGVNLGSWLVAEGWMVTSLFEGIPALIDGAALHLKSAATGCYLTADWGGGNKVSCGFPKQPSTWETFRLRRENPDRSFGGIQLRSCNQWFLSSANESAGSGLNADIWDEPDPKGPATFDIVVDPKDPLRVQLKDLRGMYLQVGKDNKLSFTCSDPSWNGPCTFNVTLTDGLSGEWQMGAGLGREKAKKVLDEHRATFITEEDFKYLAGQGINMVRIPVGFWIAQGDNPDGPFVPGGLVYLDRAFEWANKHGIRVMIDMHGVPGSQNGLQETGSRDGISEWAKKGTDHIAKALAAIEFLVARYANDPAFFAFELLNEPAQSSSPIEILSQYYEEGYRIVRKYSSCAYVVTSSRWMGTDNELMDFLTGPNYNNVILDVHWYAFYLLGESLDDVLNFWKYDKAYYLDYLSTGGRLLFGGEWSVALPPTSPFSDDDYRRFGEIQLETFAKHAKAGWAFWSYKVDENVPAFNFRIAREKGWLPYERIDAEMFAAEEAERRQQEREAHTED